MTHLVKDSPKLKDFNVLVKKFKLKESKAFSKSIATIKPGICFVFVNSIIPSIDRTRISLPIPTPTSWEVPIKSFKCMQNGVTWDQAP